MGWIKDVTGKIRLSSKSTKNKWASLTWRRNPERKRGFTGSIHGHALNKQTWHRKRTGRATKPVQGMSNSWYNVASSCVCWFTTLVLRQWLIWLYHSSSTFIGESRWIILFPLNNILEYTVSIPYYTRSGVWVHMWWFPEIGWNRGIFKSSFSRWDFPWNKPTMLEIPPFVETHKPLWKPYNHHRFTID